MNPDRKIMVKGLVVETQERIRALEVKIETYAKDVSFAVSTLAGIDRMDIESADVMFDELKSAYRLYRAEKDQLEKLKKEL